MTGEQIKNLTVESLRDWFKKEKWVRISSSGNIAGKCGTSRIKRILTDVYQKQKHKV